MADARAIKMGQGYVELATDSTKLERGLNAAGARLKQFGGQAVAFGAQIATAGLAIEAALGPAVAAFASYEQSLANLRAAANPTAAEFSQLRTVIEEVAKATGTSLEEVTAAFSELVKAGRSVGEVTSGLGLAVVQFSRVSEMTAPEAVMSLTGAMNVFSREGLSATQVMNTMSQAAETSRINLRQVSEAFTSGGAVAARYNQNMSDTAAAISLMGDAQVEGADAGTSMRRVLTNLSGDGEPIAASLNAIGLSLESFRDGAGRMLPMVQIIGTLETALGRLGDRERASAISGIGGIYGSTGLNALLRTGAAGFRERQAAMSGSLTVEAKFAILTDTFQGAMKKLWVQLQLVAVAIGESLVPAMKNTLGFVMPVLAIIEDLIKKNQFFVQVLDYTGIGLIVVGTIIAALGVLVYGLSFAFGILATVVGVIFSPWVIGFAAVAGAVYALWVNIDKVRELAADAGGWFTPLVDSAREFGEGAVQAFQDIQAAINSGDTGLAARIAFANIKIAWFDVTDAMQNSWRTTINFISTWLLRGVTGWQAIFSLGMQAMATSWAHVVHTFESGWNAFRTGAEIALAVGQAVASLSSPAAARDSAIAAGALRQRDIDRGRDSDTLRIGSEGDARLQTLRRELAAQEAIINAAGGGGAANAARAELARLQAELQTRQVALHALGIFGMFTGGTEGGARPPTFNPNGGAGVGGMSAIVGSGVQALLGQAFGTSSAAERSARAEESMLALAREAERAAEVRHREMMGVVAPRMG